LDDNFVLINVGSFRTGGNFSADGEVDASWRAVGGDAEITFGPKLRGELVGGYAAAAGPGGAIEDLEQSTDFVVVDKGSLFTAGITADCKTGSEPCRVSISEKRCSLL
jgi:hypothetical protein